MNRRTAILGAYRAGWAVARIPLRAVSAQILHDWLVRGLRVADGSRAAVGAAARVGAATIPPRPTQVGGVTLPYPVIVAAGLVKGEGFSDEEAAMAAVRSGRDIIPGWRSVPALLGPVELGSFTRWPRLGNPGTVIWRDERTRSTQNRVGLRNPGARAASAFLAFHADELPPVYGVNLAVSPGVVDDAVAASELTEQTAAFESALRAGGRAPSWYTLNLSCPNTDDDPGARQTDAQARLLAGALVRAVPVPVWVKVGPDLSTEQYATLVRALVDVGVRAIVATNTLGMASPGGSRETAGVGGRSLRPHALRAIRALAGSRSAETDLDLIACGGIMSARHLAAARAAGAGACMVYSALVFRGPLAAALILA